MKKIAIIYILIFCFFGSKGQKQIQFSEPEKLNSHINSEAEEGFPFLSMDGKSLYYTRTFHPLNVGGKLAGQDIWFSQGTGTDNWTASINDFPLLNNKNNNAIVGQSRDGKTLYLLNVYTSGNFMEYGISSWQIDSDEQPVKMEIPNLFISGKYYGFYMHPDGEVLLISAELERSKGQEDIYITIKDTNGKWQKPINVGGAINSSGFEISPFITDDLQTIYFTSSGRGGKGGADIFMSTKRGKKWNSWRPAKNLGKPINSKGFDAYFMIRNGDAYFSSNRDADHSDIFYTHIITKEELESLLPQPQTVYFGLNSYMISGSSKTILDQIVKLMSENENLHVDLSGYTCKIGNELDNLNLAEMRANSVSDYLQIYGIDDDRIKQQTLGNKEAMKFDDDENIQKSFRKVIINFKYM
ncbi:MAG: OmpA family protein [Bacteroidetes bacterium]|nr:OmpA family protein [Bacteroidota bacterium]MBT7826717.1 OmpA family protein [Bacteroidota bacterium]